MSERKLILSVTPADCELQTFSVGGAGGQRRDKKATGVRWIHHPSGARGECREERSQEANKKRAWKRMVQSPEFQLWIKLETGQQAKIEAEVARAMEPRNIKVETKDSKGRWQVS